MQSKYCLPIVKSSKTEILSDISKMLNDYGFFEVWLDYVEDLDNEFIDELLEKYESKLVFVTRRKNLEKPKLDALFRKNLIEKLNSHKCYLDLDIYNQKDDLSAAKSSNLIVSYHNYSETPDNKTLDKIVSEIKDFNPAIVKISTMCVKPDDSLRLLRVKRDLLEQGQKHIVLGMGELGKVTRVFGALWGNELIFIPENEKDSSAPGQISRTDFDKIIERIKQK